MIDAIRILYHYDVEQIQEYLNCIDAAKLEKRTDLKIIRGKRIAESQQDAVYGLQKVHAWRNRPSASLRAGGCDGLEVKRDTCDFRRSSMVV